MYHLQPMYHVYTEDRMRFCASVFVILIFETFLYVGLVQ
jgi:hypothetical protein